MSKLLESFFLDRKYKRAVYAVSGATLVIYALLDLLVLHHDEVRVSAEAACLFLFIFILGILLRPAFRKTLPGELTQVPVPDGVSRYIALLAVGIALFAV